MWCSGMSSVKLEVVSRALPLPYDDFEFRQGIERKRLQSCG